MYSKNVASSLILQIVKLVFKFVLGVLIAREFGASIYGKVAYFFLVFGLISSYGHFGIVNSVSYFAKNDKIELRQQFNSNLTYLFVNVAFIVCLINIPIVRQNIFKGMSSGYVCMGIIYVLFVYLFMTFEAYYVNENLLYKSNYCVIVTTTFITLLSTILLFFNLMNATTYIMIQILEYVIIVIFQYKVLGYKFYPTINVSFLGREFKYGQIIFWASLFGFLNYRIDQLMLKNIYGDQQLGIYSVAVSLAELVFLIPNSVSASLTAKLLNTQEKNEKKLVLIVTLKVMIIICIFLSIIGVISAPIIEVIYGKEYNQAITSFRLLLIGVIFASIGKMVYPYYVVSGRARVHLIISILVCISNIVLNFILIPIYKMNGAALASTCSYFIYGALYIFLLNKKEDISLKKLFLFDRDEIKSIINKEIRNRHENN